VTVNRLVAARRSIPLGHPARKLHAQPNPLLRSESRTDGWQAHGATPWAQRQMRQRTPGRFAARSRQVACRMTCVSPVPAMQQSRRTDDRSGSRHRDETLVRRRIVHQRGCDEIQSRPRIRVRQAVAQRFEPLGTQSTNGEPHQSHGTLGKMTNRDCNRAAIYPHAGWTTMGISRARLSANPWKPLIA
jgi:hypothetical protein